MTALHRVAITGMGVASPLGCELATVHRALAAGVSGVEQLDLPWDTGYPTLHAGLVAAPPPPLGMEPETWRQYGRAAQLALSACDQALRHAAWGDSGPTNRLGVIVGTSMGDMGHVERHWAMPPGGAANHVAANGAGVQLHSVLAPAFGLTGPCHVVTTTSAAGNHAIAWACDLLRCGVADAMLAVGVDTISYVDMLGFCRLGIQSPDCCRPFDLHRMGTILAEGGGALLLEPLNQATRRGIPIQAEVAGYGLSCDSAGPFASNVDDVDTLMLAATQALRDARCRAEDIDYISAHGTGSRLNDAKETVFVKTLLGQRSAQVPLSSIKSMLGHAQGAASSLQAIASVLSFQHHCLYPTINYSTPDPKCDLDIIPNAARYCSVDTIMSNAFGIGGHNAIVIFKRWNGK